MKKKQKVKSVVLLVLALSFLLCVVFWGIQRIREQQDPLHIDWGVRLPEKIKKQYEAKDRGFEDGSYYTVYQVLQTPDALLAECSPEKNLEFEAKTQQRLALSQPVMQIPDEKMPDWRQPYYWKQIQAADLSSQLYLIYFPDSMQLIIFEDIR